MQITTDANPAAKPHSKDQNKNPKLEDLNKVFQLFSEQFANEDKTHDSEKTCDQLRADAVSPIFGNYILNLLKTNNANSLQQKNKRRQRQR